MFFLKYQSLFAKKKFFFHFFINTDKLRSMMICKSQHIKALHIHFTSFIFFLKNERGLHIPFCLILCYGMLPMESFGVIRRKGMLSMESFGAIRRKGMVPMESFGVFRRKGMLPMESFGAFRRKEMLPMEPLGVICRKGMHIMKK